MIKKILLVLVAGLFSYTAYADIAYSCKHGNKERLITVVYAEAGKTVPCNVTYQKGDDTQTLWSAQNKEGYCEEKAEAFVAKQEGWGWSCSKNSE